MYNHTASVSRKHIGVTQGVVHFCRLSWPESRNMANGNEEMKKQENVCSTWQDQWPWFIAFFYSHSLSAWVASRELSLWWLPYYS